jgi:hypothetical protein
VKNLPPIEELCKPIPHPSTIEVTLSPTIW